MQAIGIGERAQPGEFWVGCMSSRARPFHRLVLPAMPGMNGPSEEFGPVLAVAPDLECAWDGSQQFSAPNFLGPIEMNGLFDCSQEGQGGSVRFRLLRLLLPRIFYLGICHRRHVFSFRRYKV